MFDLLAAAAPIVGPLVGGLFGGGGKDKSAEHAKANLGLGEEAFDRAWPYAQHNADFSVANGQMLQDGARFALNQAGQAAQGSSVGTPGAPSVDAGTVGYTVPQYDWNVEYDSPEYNQGVADRLAAASEAFTKDDSVLQRMRQQALNFSSPGYAEALANDSMGRHQQQSSLARDTMQRQQASMGVNPNSGRSAEMNRQSMLHDAAARTQIANQSRLQADEVGFNRLGAAGQLSTQYGQVRNQALANESQYEAQRAQTHAGLEQSRMGHRAGLQQAEMSGQFGLEGTRMQSQVSADNSSRAANASIYGSQVSAHNAGLQHDLGVRGLGVDYLNAGADMIDSATKSHYYGLQGVLDTNSAFTGGHATAFGLGSGGPVGRPTGDGGQGLTNGLTGFLTDLPETVGNIKNAWDGMFGGG